MENIDKGLIVQSKYPKCPQNVWPNLSTQAQKFGIFGKKLSLFVRSLCYGSLENFPISHCCLQILLLCLRDFLNGYLVTLSLLGKGIATIYIRSVSSQHLLSNLLNWSKLVYGPFGQNKMHQTLDFCNRPARKELNVPKLKSSYELTILIYILWVYLSSVE